MRIKSKDYILILASLILLVPSISFSNIITTVDWEGNVGWHTSIAIGADDNPVIAYWDWSNGALKVVKCGNASCSTGNIKTTVDSDGNVGWYTSIAIGGDDLPVISYYDATNKDLKVVKCGNASCTENNIITTVDSKDSVGWYTSLAIGYDDNPVISYQYRAAGVWALKVVKCGNPSCTSDNEFNEVDSAVPVGEYTSISIGADDYPIISYYDNENRDLKVAKCNDHSCGDVTITTVDAGGYTGHFTSIAIGSDDKPIISYLYFSNNDLRVAHCGDASCTSSNTITTVDATGNAGWYTSIAIGTDNLPVIAHYAVGSLKVAHCGNASCTSDNTLTTVDKGVASWDISIAIGADGRPVISYCDNTNGDLKVLKCITQTCAPAINPSKIILLFGD